MNEGDSVETSAPLKIDFKKYDILWEHGESILSDSKQSAIQFEKTVKHFLETPNQELLIEAQTAWFSLQTTYQKFYYFLRLGIAAPKAFAELSNLHYRLAAYPIQPGILDAFGPYRYAGLVHDISVPITPKSLTHQHGITDTEDVVLGIYAIEFMLFGENGERSWRDYTRTKSLSDSEREKGFKDLAETPNSRRRALLNEQISIFVADLKNLNASWNDEGSDSLKSKWLDFTHAEKSVVTRSAFEHAVTQLIVEISKLKAIGDRQRLALTTEGQESALADTNQPYPYPVSIHMKLVQTAITSLKLGVELLALQSQQAILADLQRAEALCESTHTKGEAVNPPWASIYQHLKSALDLYQMPK